MADTTPGGGAPASSNGAPAAPLDPEAMLRSRGFVVLLLFAAVAPYGWWLLPVGFLVTVLGSVLVVNLQLRLMDVAGDAQTIGAASNHASLNIANAAGAALGGLVIAAGYGYRATGVVGAALAAAGFVVLVAAALLARPGQRADRIG